MNETLDGDEMLAMYEWLDSFTLSKPKKSISRDFSDGVLYAELIKKHVSHLVQLNNYVPTSNLAQKRINWEMLNKKVLLKLGFQIGKTDIEGVINCKSFYIEKVLIKLKYKLTEYMMKIGKKNEMNYERDFKEEDEEDEAPILTKELFYKNEMESKDKEINRLKEMIKVSNNIHIYIHSYIERRKYIE
jgi:hypothetical protein